MKNWKKIPGFNNRYSISLYGEVRDDQRNVLINAHMSGVKRRNYPQVTLYKKVEDEKTTKHTKRIHSLMAITFLDHVYDGSRKIVVDHIDNNPLNNKIDNLRLVTMKENTYRHRNN
jgi:hypothetical protein